MPPIEQFIIGHFKGYGSTIRTSPGVHDLLSTANWNRLLQLGGDIDAELKKRGTDHLEVRTTFWDDQVVAYSYLKPTRDEVYGRPGVYNHTILVPIECFIDAFNAQTKITPLFLYNPEEPPPKNPLSRIPFEV